MRLLWITVLLGLFAAEGCGRKEHGAEPTKGIGDSAPDVARPSGEKVVVENPPAFNPEDATETAKWMLTMGMQAHADLAKRVGNLYARKQIMADLEGALTKKVKGARIDWSVEVLQVYQGPSISFRPVNGWIANNAAWIDLFAPSGSNDFPAPAEKWVSSLQQLSRIRISGQIAGVQPIESQGPPRPSQWKFYVFLKEYSLSP